MRPKVTVIGTDSVGVATAQRLAERDYADVVLVDVGNGHEDAAGSRIVVVTVPDDAARIAREIRDRSPDAVVIVASRQLETVCHIVADVTEFPRPQIVGAAGVVNSARFRAFVARELGVSSRDVTGLVLGGSSDSMVPLPSYCTVAGVPVRQRLSGERLRAIVERTREGGAAWADHATSAAVSEMTDAIVLDQKRLLSCTALCQGEYGIDNLFVGVPVKLGGQGIEEIVEVELSDDEHRALQQSAAAVRESLEAMKSR